MREYIDYEFSPVKVSSNGVEMEKICQCVKSLCKNDNNYAPVFFFFFPIYFFLQDKISFEYDIERIIDDWILMGFLVGNDFIPHLPHLHINHDALPLLYRTYMAILPELGGEKTKFSCGK